MPNKLNTAAAKKRLKCGKELMILLSVYKVYGMSFDDQDEAVDFVRKMMEWEEKEEREL